MIITISLHSLGSRIAMSIVAATLVVGFVVLALARFVTEVAADPGLAVTGEMIETTVLYFPNNAPLHARLAARLVEANSSESKGYEDAADLAVYHASRAVKLAPQNYEYRLLLAGAKELKGELPEAEASLRAARGLAPNKINIRWQLANLLLREGKLDDSRGEFRAVVVADPGKIPATFGLLWQASNGRLEILNEVAGDGRDTRLALAQFLLDQRQFEAAADIFSGIERKTRLGSPECGKVFDALLAASQFDLAAKMWRELFGDGEQSELSLIWNGSFETAVRKGLAQFDWNFGQSSYARVGIANGGARTGQRALRVAYLGIETTRLEGEVQQLILVSPGTHYRLEGFAKAEGLNNPDGPRIAVIAQDTRELIATSAPVATGSHDWQTLSIEFVAPPDKRALLVTIKQTPKYSYVEPTQGTVWFDDLKLREQ